MARLEGLLNRLVKPLPGKEAELARHPREARPLSGPTPEVRRIQALRELKASSQAVSLRLNALRQTKEGDPMHNAFFVNLQRNIMANPAAIARLAPALHRQVDEAATAPASITNGQAHLDRFRRAIDYTAHLFAGQAPQQRVMPAIVPEKPQKREAKAVPATEAPKLKAPASKRRGPKL